MTTTCKVYLVTGNCPVLGTCKQSHPENKPSEKPRKKLLKPKPGNDFRPPSNTQTDETKTIGTTSEEIKTNDTTATTTTDSKNTTTTTEEIKKDGDGGKKKLKLAGSKQDFKPTTGGAANDFLGKFEEEKGNLQGDSFQEGDTFDDLLEEGLYYDDLYIDHDPMHYHEPSKGCTCCNGHIFNCDGQICQNLESCFCYALEEDEKAYQQSRAQ